MAVKVLDSGAGDDTFRRSTRELQLFASIRSPYLVRLFDAGQDGGILLLRDGVPPARLARLAGPASRPDGGAAAVDPRRARRARPPRGRLRPPRHQAGEHLAERARRRALGPRSGPDPQPRADRHRDRQPRLDGVHGPRVVMRGADAVAGLRHLVARRDAAPGPDRRRESTASSPTRRCSPCGPCCRRSPSPGAVAVAGRGGRDPSLPRPRPVARPIRPPTSPPGSRLWGLRHDDRRPAPGGAARRRAPRPVGPSVVFFAPDVADAQGGGAARPVSKRRASPARSRAGRSPAASRRCSARATRSIRRSAPSGSTETASR